MSASEIQFSRSGRRAVDLVDETYERLKVRILYSEIAPGQHVTIDSVARAHNVSHTPVREALARLEADGLLVKEANRGYSASPLLTAAEFTDLFQFRLLIEPWCAAQAARQVEGAEVDQLTREVELQEALLSNAETPFRELTESDNRLHQLIARMSRNEATAKAFERTHAHMHLYRLYLANIQVPAHGTDFVHELFHNYYSGGDSAVAVREHRGIVDAIRAADPVRAKRLMKDHIKRSQASFAPVVRRVDPA
ncbi:GntR family transcriptional regulator [Microbacterium sp. SLBN-154]|uniref:GntR family transcriptional regulator n=1 Tax=Microbacterium sp. SLBN-154 TaxID=2768458 RepID=UPI00114E4C20|nr:GntR family transcriptional regulator [Microbacterium sp. SLBN-154]TQK17709.1 GntR family transcriptional regulator [Microbacterium sp. SLBN-154]